MANYIIANQFTDVERVMLNKICEGKLLSNLSKDEVVAELIISQAVSIQDWESVFDILIEKFENMSDDEWQNLKKEVPLFVSYSFGTYSAEDKHSFLPSVDNIAKGG